MIPGYVLLAKQTSDEIAELEAFARFLGGVSQADDEM